MVGNRPDVIGDPISMLLKAVSACAVVLEVMSGLSDVGCCAGGWSVSRATSESELGEIEGEKVDNRGETDSRVKEVTADVGERIVTKLCGSAAGTNGDDGEAEGGEVMADGEIIRVGAVSVGTVAV